MSKPIHRVLIEFHSVKQPPKFREKLKSMLIPVIYDECCDKGPLDLSRESNLKFELLIGSDCIDLSKDEELLELIRCAREQIASLTGSQLITNNNVEPLDLSKRSLMELVPSAQPQLLAFANGSPMECDTQSGNSSPPSSPPSSVNSMIMPVVSSEGQVSTRPQDNFWCSKCDKTFRKRSQFKSHMTRHKNKETGRYKCEICFKHFVQKSSLTSHLHIHAGTRPYGCSHCNKRFSDLSTARKHERVHTGEKPYKCTHCNRGFSQSGNMLRHLKLHRNSKGKKDRN